MPIRDTPIRDNPVRDNPEQSRFELDAEGGLALACYRRRDGVLTFTHTEVPERLRGRGIASRLVAGALDKARAEGLKIVPACAFVAAYVSAHPDVADLVA